MPLFKKQEERPVSAKDPVLWELRQENLDLKTRLNREALAAASDLAEKDEVIAALRRELDRRTQRIVFLEGELERIETAFYEANAKAATHAARVRRIKELEAEGKSRTAIMKEVFPYDGGWGWEMVNRVVNSTEAYE